MTHPVVRIAVAGCLAISVLGCDSFERGKTRGSNINSMMAIRDVSIALENYRQAHGSYPTAHTIAELQREVAPLLNQARTTDRWGEALLVDVTADGYTISSKGSDRTGGHEFGGAVTTPGHSITLKDGAFVQYDVSVLSTAAKYSAELADIRKHEREGG